MGILNKIYKDKNTLKIGDVFTYKRYDDSIFRKSYFFIVEKFVTKKKDKWNFGLSGKVKYIDLDINEIDIKKCMKDASWTEIYIKVKNPVAIGSDDVWLIGTDIYKVE